ncbi:bifunctional lysylphosphatidylglycerol flippase/synthetase MprF [Corynebacterium liangguodongii]|uniref:Uncharacterized protein n=1 Tax=Corynebacterium liangguodongii TaxID=2079535 RepID=A0A2S0WDK1_9CORY|nr:phosphatidylglycerol lysyltransferase domain-containing protein [Corynebacterium liangguodongii]AWB83848.1 hypothetical protein C3E79_04605 [Corynebacterium liangguodongii]PWB98968.1 DUF2156 domain-containing protein [Corynebacterium liangguodongii]
MSALKKAALRFPASVVALAGMWVLYALFGRGAYHILGYHILGEENIASFLTSGLTSWHPAGMVYATFALVCFAVPAEILLGTRRFIVAALASHALAVPIGAVLAAAVERAGFNEWGANLAAGAYLSPVAWIFGPLAFATSTMGVLWRRRLRLIMVVLTGTLVLYSGSLVDVIALSAVVLGWAGGSLVHRESIQRVRVSLREARVLIATLFAVVSAGPVLAALNPQASGPFAQVSQLMWEPAVAANEIQARCVDVESTACREALLINQQDGLGPFLLNMAPLALALVIAFGLVRGRRVAWVLAILSAAGSLVIIFAQVGGPTADVLRAVNVVLVILPWLIVLAVLAATRAFFRVASSLRPAIVGTAGALVVCTIVWVAGALANPGFLWPPSLGEALLEAPARFLPPAAAVLLPTHVIPQRFLAWVLYEWVGIAFWAAALFFLHRALTSAPSPAAETERQRAQEILTRGTGDHLAWMGLWGGNRYFFAGGGEGYVAFRVVRNVAVTVGGPVYTEASTRDDVADAFEAYCAEQGWRVAWYSVAEDFSRTGFRRVHVAEESLLYTDNIEFKGKKFQNIRTARNRAGKEGVRAVWTTWAELDVEMREKVFALSEQWVADKALPEMGFTLGGVDELAVEGTKLLLAVGDDGRLHGVTSWLPVYEGGQCVGYTLDFMRRDTAGFRPTVEFLLAEAAAIAAAEGKEWVSLSGAPLARTSEPDSLLEVLLDRTGARIEPLYGFRSLAASKYKFHPTHSGWYLAYDDELALGAIALAVVSCYLPTMRPSDYAGVVREFLARRDRDEPELPGPAPTPRP